MHTGIFAYLNTFPSSFWTIIGSCSTIIAQKVSSHRIYVNQRVWDRRHDAYQKIMASLDVLLNCLKHLCDEELMSQEGATEEFKNDLRLGVNKNASILFEHWNNNSIDLSKKSYEAVSRFHKIHQNLARNKPPEIEKNEILYKAAKALRKTLFSQARKDSLI